MAAGDSRGGYRAPIRVLVSRLLLCPTARAIVLLREAECGRLAMGSWGGGGRSEHIDSGLSGIRVQKRSAFVYYFQGIAD
ncbi:hypothetical protein NDU88_004063 [Pleurodeles waltl]|uniref:Secreted protein n=1 Tax=Pleurodeles waltl TaxID=8319 RepID=A0AAV7L5M7_PLEWA|nr:hypothetical protein NDU88_004063 [Pleurodeles waltl]